MTPYKNIPYTEYKADDDLVTMQWSVGLPLTSSFLLEYSSEYLNEYFSLILEVL